MVWQPLIVSSYEIGVLKVKMRYLRLKKKLIHKIYSKVYIDRNKNNTGSVFIAGTGRSGTTWLADIISSQIPCRVMFEPFQSMLVKDYSMFHYHQYMRPMENNQELHAYCHRILSGNIRHRWIDRHINHVFPSYRIIKDIRANLFLKWFNNNFPEVPILFIVRHPCAVVLSHLELSWPTDIDVASFLIQDKLVSDFLLDKLDIIQSADTIEEKCAVVWCVTNLIPFEQFGYTNLAAFFYENLCTQPEREIRRIFQLTQLDCDASVFDTIGVPSTTAQLSSAVMTGQDKIGGWTKKLSSAQIKRILSVVRAFGLDHIYDESLMPLERVWEF
jgi:hypothetical protein